MSDCNFEIYDIMACDVFWDYGTPGLPKQQHKFLVAFYATKGKFTPDLIDEIVCHGPNGYETHIANQKFTGHNRNGFIHDPLSGNYWYMHNCATGFMEEGEYRIDVVCKNGEVKSKSRFQQSAPARTLVSSYLANADAIYASFSPSEKQPLPDGTPLTGTKVRWTPLKELSRHGRLLHLSRRRGRLEVGVGHPETGLVGQHLHRADFEPTAGLNRSEVAIGATLKPKASYLYFVEITDNNAMGETNICIFQPFRRFVTPEQQAAGVAAQASG